ncbi:MAG: 3-oxoacyl-[acyl-carrier-protein] synthase III C-terminal domain-containing protein [Nostoc sp. ChiSLP02]|nr:3-oxoacyl-[acyl-carrier-protein] synthase III C-terminal domain-containing protein [Nostoc sp. DedSLP05]MDZ8103254.1 3-oxoacyl-[acyl-carrier-protein] synthase III C-terminal domain-containing protein [Nostoc sp. DedSLP01]MDZ8187701.1 3-oxoacyl-[acyl-carrier-protein] synthase III C-terminal domain-containing protein [Nostoc sp. ChiSLP02]
MNEVFVNNFSYVLGDETYTVEEAVAQGRTLSTTSVLQEAGFRKHYVCSSKTNAYDLAKLAIEKIQDDLGDIGAIVYSTCIPMNGNIGYYEKFQETRDVKYLMDFPASHLQSDFGIERATVIGLNQQACTGMLGSLHLAKMLLLCEPDVKRVLCVTSDRFPQEALYEQAYNLISDGAAACIVSHEPAGFRLIANHAITNGAMYLASDDETVGSYFSYTYRLIQEILRKTNLEIGQIDWIVSQNTHINAWQILSRILKFDPERVYFQSLPEAGHVISGDNIINLTWLMNSGKIKSGDRIMLVMAGYGLNWQSVILEKI